MERCDGRTYSYVRSLFGSTGAGPPNWRLAQGLAEGQRCWAGLCWQRESGPLIGRTSVTGPGTSPTVAETTLTRVGSRDHSSGVSTEPVIVCFCCKYSSRGLAGPSAGLWTNPRSHRLCFMPSRGRLLVLGSSLRARRCDVRQYAANSAGVISGSTLKAARFIVGGADAVFN